MIVRKHPRATRLLLEGGADSNRAHPLFGSALHAAVSVGDVGLLQLLIDRGGDVNALNPRGQTPLQVMAVGRTTKDRLREAQAKIESMGVELPGLVDHLSWVTLPIEGWDACERLLKEHGAR